MRKIIFKNKLAGLFKYVTFLLPPGIKGLKMKKDICRRCLIMFSKLLLEKTAGGLSDQPFHIPKIV